MSKSIAIVIAAYNCEKTIMKSLDSIRRLSSSPDEIVIVNDGSTDNTLDVLESYEGLDYKVISKINGGCASARNLGFLNLSSDYVLLLDADDELESSAICKLKDHLKEQAPDFVFIGETRVRENSREYHRAYIDPDKPLEYCLINDCPSSCMVGGKTGTTEKIRPDGGYYKDRNIASFAATFPVHDPRYVLVVMVDEPKGQKHSGGYATGGWVAAPAARHIIENAAPLLGIHPVDEKAPEIRQKLQLDFQIGKEKKTLASF